MEVKKFTDYLKEDKVNESNSNKSDIAKFITFALTYKHNFIEEMFAENGENMIKHLKSKFDTAYEKRGSYGAMVDFYTMLDNENQLIFDKYVSNL